MSRYHHLYPERRQGKKKSKNIRLLILLDAAYKIASSAIETGLNVFQ